jgi:hypothetical protein
MKIRDLHLVAFYVMKPRDPKQTHIKGYLKNPANIQYDERLELTRGLHHKDLQYAGIVLNLKNKKVIKNSFRDEKSFDTLFKYFLEAYPKYIMEVMNTLDPGYLAQFLNEQDGVVESSVVDAQVTKVSVE